MPELMSDAINLMLVGMGFVFVFLAILVLVTSTMSKIVTRFSPAPAPVSLGTETGSDSSRKTGSFPSRDAQLVAVITAAISKYRSQRKP